MFWGGFQPQRAAKSLYLWRIASKRSESGRRADHRRQAAIGICMHQTALPALPLNVRWQPGQLERLQYIYSTSKILLSSRSIHRSLGLDLLRYTSQGVRA